MFYKDTLRPFAIGKSHFWRSTIFMRSCAGILLVALVLSLVRPAHASILYIANSTVGGNGGTLTINKPTGAQNGDLVILSVSIRTDTASVTCPNGDTPMNSTVALAAPAGFTTITTQSATSNVTSFYKFVTSTDPATYTANFSGTCAKAAGGFGSGSATAKFAAVAAAYSGVDRINPINIFDSQATSGATLTAPSVTTTATDTMLVSMFTTPGAETLTSGNVTVRNQAQSTGGSGATKNTLMLGDGYVLAAGATGTRTATNTGTGNGSAMTVALNTKPTLTQTGYRWFANNTTAGSVGAPLADQDTAIAAPAAGQPFRLRMLIGANDGPLLTANTFKLQYKLEQSGACTATGGYTDVTSSGPIQYFDNAGVADAAAIVTNGNDPVRSGITKVSQTYEESNNFTVSTSIPKNQDGMWDFALMLGNDADDSGMYCFRAISSSGTVLNSYSQIPGIILSTNPSSVKGQEYRYFQNANSANPGTALAGTNTMAALSATGDQFRLRTGIKLPGYFKQLAGGSSHTCGVSSERKAYCWGSDSNGQLGDGPALANKSTPAAVNMNSVLAGKTILSISAGMTHTCAIASDGLVYCWGSDQQGQLGNDAANADQSAPVAVDTSGVLSGKTILSITAGYYHTCAIASDNLAYCWGSDQGGQLGDDAILSSQQPTPVAVSTSGIMSGKTILSMTTEGAHTCAIGSDNLAYCWGSDGGGQLGDGLSVTSQPTPVAVSTSGVLSGKTIKSISAGGTHTCAVASDDLPYCWGSDMYGGLGNDVSLTDQAIPVAVNTSGVLSGKTIRSISSNGEYFTCAVASDNQVYCWGQGQFYGQLGNSNTLANQPTPVAVSTAGTLNGKSIRSITTGDNHTCAISFDNLAYCWGRDIEGQLGNNSTFTSQSLAVAVDQSNGMTAKTVTDMALGSGWGCALAASQASCWGSDVVGQLGNDDDSVTQSSAVAVSTSGALSGKTIQSVSGKKDHACAIANDNLVYCWGGDANGQLGNDATLANQRVPVAVNTSGVLSGKTISKLSAGSDHSCVIANDNLGYCWGAGFAGRLGNGSVTTQATPVAVTMTGVLAGKTLKQISAGFGHTCAIASDDKAYCWGESDNGRLGTGTIGTDALTPVAVSDAGALSGKILTSISAGVSHTCVLSSDNQAFCWGDDANGQLGNGTATGDQASPVAIDMSGALSGKTILSIASGKDNTCVIASDNLPYCWGTNSTGQLGRGDMTTTEESAAAVSVSGALAGKTILKIFAGFYDQTCVIASDNRSYCWGVDNVGQLGDNTDKVNQTQPVPVSDSLMSTPHIAANTLSIRLYYAQKTAPTCQAQTGFAAITNTTPVSFNDNAGVTNGSMMVHGTNNPVTDSSIMPQGYYDSLPTSVTNQNLITHAMTNIWDFSLRDNGAPASTTYCLRVVGDAGDNFGLYESYPEITTAAASGGGSDPQAGLLRGGQAVLNGVKQIFSW